MRITIEKHHSPNVICKQSSSKHIKAFCFASLGSVCPRFPPSSSCMYTVSDLQSQEILQNDQMFGIGTNGWTLPFEPLGYWRPAFRGARDPSSAFVSAARYVCTKEPFGWISARTLCITFTFQQCAQPTASLIACFWFLSVACLLAECKVQ